MARVNEDIKQSGKRYEVNLATRNIEIADKLSMQSID